MAADVGSDVGFAETESAVLDVAAAEVEGDEIWSSQIVALNRRGNW